jgi:hypothetical protein
VRVRGVLIRLRSNEAIAQDENAWEQVAEIRLGRMPVIA